MNRYPFCLFRIPENNSGRVLWEITNTCNYNCVYCIFSSEKQKIDNELDEKEVFNVLQQLRNRNFSYIKFTGGEPFVRNDITRILKKAKDLGFDMDISTNASLITEEKAKELKEIGLDMIHVSLDGHNFETHEKVRGENTFEHTIKGIKNLVKEKVYVRLGSLIYKDNEDKIEEIVKLAIILKVNEIVFSFMESVGRLAGDNTLISNKKIEDVKRELEELKEKYQDKILLKYSFTEDTNNSDDGVCPAVNKFLYIDNLGFVSPCTWVVEQDKKYKSKLSLKNNTLEEIIESEEIDNYLKYISKNNIKGCPVKRR